MKFELLFLNFLYVFGDNIIHSNNGKCGTQRIELPTLEPECRTHESVTECRYIELENPSCVVLPCFGNMTLNIELKTETPPGRCCKSCTCFGDPHCLSFSGHKETGILCDSRKQHSRKGHCIHSKKICLQQRDFQGNQCKWKRLPRRNKWNVGLYGSRCTFSGPRPRILMYETETFSANILLGERGVIDELELSMSGRNYNLKASDCFNLDNPWDGGMPLLSINTTLHNNDIRWVVDDPDTEISVVILCTRNRVGNIEGNPRLNIEDISEPSLQSRKNSNGFCVTNTLDRGMSNNNERTQFLQDTDACIGNRNIDEVKLGKHICGIGVNVNNVDECKKNWCQKSYTSTQECLYDINQYGWRKAWCSVNTMIIPDPSNCSGDCNKCYNEINDFGYDVGVSKWKNYITITDKKCLTLDDIPDRLEECEKGLNIQYEFSPGVWETYKSIPDGYALCEDVVFNSHEHQELFTYKIRIEQCPVHPKCVINRCNADPGFKLVLNYKKAPEMCVCEDI